MLYKKIPLSETDPEVFLEVFVSDSFDVTRDALLICPGGAYHDICSDREGEPIALAFMPYCFNCFVLHYSVDTRALFPRPLIEASLAVKHIKDNAEEYRINKDRIFVTGFSAGGHLCTALGTLWHMPEIYEATGMEYGYNKPTAIVPVYPVVVSNPEFAYRGGFYNIVGKNKTEEEYEVYSLEKRVDERSVPAFIVHTAADQIVNVRNSISLADAYAKNKIPFELHIFEEGEHGMAVSNEITAGDNATWNNAHNAKWVELAAEWMKHI